MKGESKECAPSGGMRKLAEKATARIQEVRQRQKIGKKK